MQRELENDGLIERKTPNLSTSSSSSSSPFFPATPATHNEPPRSLRRPPPLPPPHQKKKMPTGTGKTITLLSLITSYQLAHPEVGKLIYCTRTVPEMEKVLVELSELVAYRARYFETGGGGAGEAAAAGQANGTGAAAAAVASRNAGSPPQILALGLSSRKNLCVNPDVADEASRESADAKCRRLTASWVRERAQRARAAAAGGGRGGDGGGGGCGGGGGGGCDAGVGCGGACGEGGEAAAPAPPSIEDIGKSTEASSPSLCAWHEGLEAAGGSAVLDPGVYTLADLRAVGRRKKWCPYFLARHMLAFANVIGERGPFFVLSLIGSEGRRERDSQRGEANPRRAERRKEENGEKLAPRDGERKNSKKEKKLKTFSNLFSGNF